MVTFLKVVAPLVSPLGGIVDSTDFKAIENQLKLLETITDDLPDLVVESDPLRSIVDPFVKSKKASLERYFSSIQMTLKD
jgi:hypothetical protein